ncbi:MULTISPECIES: acyl-CoA thioesterase [Pseudomonas]|uniref:acyl-CoA thioesterase n=1 Tax=Pseudomonas TaxID=286 RepID=UPI000D6F098A|nr:thioesterase family protein [Pseudomonas sp. RW407]PWU29408.1 acyl-CoA thioesterase [Pseudomonas sp. RW407]
MTDSALHPFDRALALEADAGDADLFHGHTSDDYWNMVGPFGGITAAILLQAVLRHPRLLGAPIALTVNFAAAIEAGAFAVRATPIRTNRSTQHWLLQLSQVDADGVEQVSTTGTAVTALRRETWSELDLVRPQAEAPAQTPPLNTSGKGVAWVQQYEMRAIDGAFPSTWDGSGEHSRTRLWLRDARARALDFPALAAMSDIFYPRVWLRRATPVPAGTVSITTYFHTDAAQLAEVGSGYLLGDARGQAFRNGYFDQAAELWSEAGELLATSNQIVYYKQ